MSALSLGIDPGISGALALLDSDGIVLLADLPVIRDKSLAWIDGGELQSLLLNALQGRPCRAVVERVSSMPKQGVASSFAFGVGFGSILAVLQPLRLPLEFVTPAVWKLGMGLSKDKRAALDNLMYSQQGASSAFGKSRASLTAGQSRISRAHWQVSHDRAHSRHR